MIKILFCFIDTNGRLTVKTSTLADMMTEWYNCQMLELLSSMLPNLKMRAYTSVSQVTTWEFPLQ